MATKKKAAKLKFEVSRSGLGGLAIVLFCLFVWCFIFGVWAGQSLLPGERAAADADAGKSTVKLAKMKILSSRQHEDGEHPPLLTPEKKAIKKEK